MESGAGDVCEARGRVAHVEHLLKADLGGISVLVGLGRVGVPACLHIALQKQPRDTRLRFHVLDQRGPRGVKLQLLEFCPVSCSLVGPCDGDERQRQGKQREPENDEIADPTTTVTSRRDEP